MIADQVDCAARVLGISGRIPLFWAWLSFGGDWHRACHHLNIHSLPKFRRFREWLSDYVLDESVTIIRVRVSHKAAVAFGQSILGSNVVELLPIESDGRLAAWEIFRKYADQEFSFTDCTSFALMRKLRLKTAFTFDGHFSQMGFTRF